MAHAGEHGGDRAHARAADADDVDRARTREIEVGLGMHVGRGTGGLLDEVGDARGGVGTAERRARRRHGVEPRRVGEQRVELARRGARPSSSASATTTAAPARDERLGVRGLVVARRAGERHEHRRHADDGELGHGDRAGAADDHASASRVSASMWSS